MGIWSLVCLIFHVLTLCPRWKYNSTYNFRSRPNIQLMGMLWAVWNETCMGFVMRLRGANETGKRCSVMWGTVSGRPIPLSLCTGNSVPYDPFTELMFT